MFKVNGRCVKLSFQGDKLWRTQLSRHTLLHTQVLAEVAEQYAEAQRAAQDAKGGADDGKENEEGDAGEVVLRKLSKAEARKEKELKGMQSITSFLKA